MARIDFWLFGYCRLKISPEDLSALGSILLRAGIPSVVNSDGDVIVRERDYPKIKDLISGRIEFTSSEPLGLYGGWLRAPCKVGIIITLLISIALCLFLSTLVWDIRVEGNLDLTDGEVILALSECGLEVGDFWGAVNRSKVETALLSLNPKVAWVNINRHGTVAYVRLIERTGKPQPIEQGNNSYSNIVATADCVIEEITVRRGIALVKPGDTVRKGDILVLGRLPDEFGGAFCAADASVIGRINERISLSLCRSEEKNSYIGRQIYSVTIKIFKFSLNIFKLYGNLTNECDIIENEIAYSLFNICKLPVSIKTVYLMKSESLTVNYTDDELVNIASKRLNSLTASRLESADLLRIKTDGEFTDEGYIISSDIVYLSEVGESAKLNVN